MKLELRKHYMFRKLTTQIVLRLVPETVSRRKFDWEIHLSKCNNPDVLRLADFNALKLFSILGLNILNILPFLSVIKKLRCPFYPAFSYILYGIWISLQMSLNSTLSTLSGQSSSDRQQRALSTTLLSSTSHNKFSVTPSVECNDDEPDSGTGDSDNEATAESSKLHRNILFHRCCICM